MTGLQAFSACLTMLGVHVCHEQQNGIAMRCHWLLATGGIAAGMRGCFATHIPWG